MALVLCRSIKFHHEFQIAASLRLPRTPAGMRLNWGNMSWEEMDLEWESEDDEYGTK